MFIKRSFDIDTTKNTILSLQLYVKMTIALTSMPESVKCIKIIKKKSWRFCYFISGSLSIKSFWNMTKFVHHFGVVTFVKKTIPKSFHVLRNFSWQRFLKFCNCFVNFMLIMQKIHSPNYFILFIFTLLKTYQNAGKPGFHHFSKYLSTFFVTSRHSRPCATRKAKIDRGKFFCQKTKSGAVWCKARRAPKVV